uniref:Fucosyltransferase n=1 Tax=Pyxicephalus adspersus TaxID=30357 RepID=A0AAV2ZUM9_PYXAD|nr:TPA: hypothetical protein GDO54_004564 [Pyxicephalus adspersus]
MVMDVCCVSPHSYYFAALCILCLFSCVCAGSSQWDNLGAEYVEGDTMLPDPGVDDIRQDLIHSDPISEQHLVSMPGQWEESAFQPSSVFSTQDLGTVMVDSYRGPGNSDTRSNKELPILLWWSENLFPHFPGDTERIDCPQSSCMVTKNKRVRLHKRTKSIIFYGTDFRAYEAPLPRLPHQTWALFHEESPMNNYVLSHLPGIRLFNYTATFRRESNYPLTLQWLPSIHYLQNPAVSLAEKNMWREKGYAPILYMQSHCDVPSDRDRYVKELMKYIQVDSYGQCLKNRPLPNKRLEDTSTATTEDPEFMAFTSRNDEEYLRYLEYKKPGGTNNKILVESLENREWGVNDMTAPNYLNGFECFVCDQENARLKAEKRHRKGKGPVPVKHIATYSHMGCPLPVPGLGSAEAIPEDDSWKQMWLQDYWQGYDQGEALTAMILRNETSQDKFWDFMHEMFIKRNMNH